MSVETKPQITRSTAPRSEQKSGKSEQSGFLTTLNVVTPFRWNIILTNPAITESDAKDAA
ncbi:MAG TPA: hypothetical protein VF480_05250 [Verrucomicrobiae bacterium]